MSEEKKVSIAVVLATIGLMAWTQGAWGSVVAFACSCGVYAFLAYLERKQKAHVDKLHEELEALKKATTENMALLKQQLDGVMMSRGFGL